jgi:HK97 family phage prohead protease
MNTPTISDLTHRLITLSTGAKGLRTQLPVQVSVPADTAAPVIDIRVSDETLDRYGEIITASGWRLENYRNNPVIQNAHQYGDVIFTLGKAIHTEVVGSALVQRWEFAVEANPCARIAYGLYRGGFLNSASVGFIPMRWENGNEKTAWSRKYLEQELLEVSAVGIPANPNALMLALKAGAVCESDIHDLRKLIASVAADVRRLTASKHLSAAFRGDTEFSPRINSRAGKRTITLH